MVVTKENFKKGLNKQHQSKSDMKDKTLPKFLVFFGLLAGWCSLVVYSTLTS
ncbi:hypothetical protein AB4343_11235 [Vibrio breoganii]|uniref:Uncharacterized protein n=1 Tax=Vibrio breoganii TaxID=553239 RepID=A0ABX1UBI8_9VIBR|nr:hypothetical protein [Vibrio breoganii]NMO74327.1 hypothetical protein [Vibrio breoganii]NMR71095.1 hypothetical protein [Vibrio breoganii]